MKPMKHYRDQYVRLRLTGDQKEGDIFPNLLVGKARSNKDVYAFLNKASNFTSFIHRIRIRKHDESGKIIGIDIQTKDYFPLVEFNHTKPVYGDTLDLGKDLDRFLPLSDVRDWRDLKFKVLYDQELLGEVRPPRQVKESDRFRNSLRNLDKTLKKGNKLNRSYNPISNKPYNLGRSKHVSEVKVVVRKAPKAVSNG